LEQGKQQFERTACKCANVGCMLPITRSCRPSPGRLEYAYGTLTKARHSYKPTRWRSNWVHTPECRSEPWHSSMSIEDAAGQFSFDDGRLTFDLLRQKWGTVPGGLAERIDSDALLGLTDRELRDYWEGVWAQTSTGAGFPVRGWYHALYADVFAG